MQSRASRRRSIEWHAARGFKSAGAVSGWDIGMPGGDGRVRGIADQDNAHGRPGAGVPHPAAGAVRLVLTLRVGKAGWPEEGKSGRGSQAGKGKNQNDPCFSRHLILPYLRMMICGIFYHFMLRRLLSVKNASPPAIGKGKGKCIKGRTRDWSSRAGSGAPENRFPFSGYRRIMATCDRD